MDCPQCGGAVVTYSLEGHDARVCEDCGYVGIPADHRGEAQAPESWEVALRRFFERHDSGGVGPRGAGGDASESGRDGGDGSDGDSPEGEKSACEESDGEEPGSESDDTVGREADLDRAPDDATDDEE